MVFGLIKYNVGSITDLSNWYGQKSTNGKKERRREKWKYKRNKKEHEVNRKKKFGLQTQRKENGEKLKKNTKKRNETSFNSLFFFSFIFSRSVARGQKM